MGIKLTAGELGIDLAYTPFRKIAVYIDNGQYKIRSKGKDFSSLVKDVKVVLNRAQSKNRRLFAVNILEALGKRVVNPACVEYLCFSKLRTLLHLWKEGINIPRTVYVPCDSHEYDVDGNEIHNEEDIADLVQRELGKGEIVVKPDAATHGKRVRLTRGREDLLKVIGEIKPSVTNPIGILAQEYVQKWFYDLRIVVAKESGGAAHCYPKALARAGFNDFRTNTYLGNMVFGVNLPPRIKGLAVKCGEIIGKDSEAWVLALDAMLHVGKEKIVDDNCVKSDLKKLEVPYNNLRKIKKEETRKRDFPTWNARLEKAFHSYMSLEAYENVKKVIEESVERRKQNVVFHEVNSCPEFWEQTRLVAEINLAAQLLRCAQSIIDLEASKD